MDLTREEEKLLDGSEGEALSSAYRILAAVGEATDASKLVPVQWAHVSGVNYNTIGEAGRKFLEKFSLDAKVRVRTTINPMGFDREKPSGISQEFVSKQMSIVESYKEMGAIESYTCIPYEVYQLPKHDSIVSFAETNAAVFVNSISGLLTNKESALSALASAITGKAPLSELRIKELRIPKHIIRSSFDMKTELDFGLLGYFAGKEIRGSSVGIQGVNIKTVGEAKALSAGIGTTGDIGMFVLNKQSMGDSISFGKSEANSIRDELNTAEKGDIVLYGSPQLGLDELELLARNTEGKKFTKPCIIFCPRELRNQAKANGIVDQLESTGAKFMCDCCICLTPLVTKENADSVVTNSVKGAYYMKNANNLGVALQDSYSITKEYMT
ncbi:MAG: aconitase X catalytic domain-containing protein [Nitrososphaeraceae archaeon]